MHRWDIINHFIQKKNYKSYLEIGYFKGWSFDNVKCEDKTAVDPNPSKLPKMESAPYLTIIGHSDSDKIYKLTSDDFFAEYAFVGGIKNKWDLIFIDGLHEASQVKKDIMNSLEHLSPNGTIILHDCNPPTLAHSTTGDAGGNWNGDVYKAWITFRFQYPEYETYTVDTDWGCGVIESPVNEISDTYIDGLFKGEDIRKYIESWDLFDQNRKDLLGLISVEQFKENHERTKNINLSTK